MGGLCQETKVRRHWQACGGETTALSPVGTRTAASDGYGLPQWAADFPKRREIGSSLLAVDTATGFGRCCWQGFEIENCCGLRAERGELGRLPITHWLVSLRWPLL